MSAYQIVLASASPRRRELLAQIGVACTVQPAQVDETVQPAESPEAYVQRLALAKAEAVRQNQPTALVLGADTVVVCDGVILGKPADETDAVWMLLALAGHSHEVLTAVALLGDTGEWTALSRSRVWLREISRAETQAYWASGEPADKAGGYAIQGLGAAFIERLKGSYSGVMGLPLFETAELLQRAGVKLFERFEKG